MSDQKRVSFELDSEQSARYLTWLDEILSAHFREGVCSPDITVTFQLSSLGRFVEARCGSSSIILQDDFS